MSITKHKRLPESKFRTRERLKLVLRQYELRERHFESFVRSKELELLLARYRETEQRQLVEAERSRLDRLEEDVGSFPPMTFQLLNLSRTSTSARNWKMLIMDRRC